MRVLKNKKIVSAAIAILIFLISCSIFSLLDTTSIISDETTEIDDTKNMLRSSALSPVFDGMYVNYTLSDDLEYHLSNFSYSQIGGSIFNQTLILEEVGEATWLVDIQTRIMFGGSFFGDGSHDPIWIFTSASLDDTIPISVFSEGDHSFLVSDELVYDLPGYGLIGVWVLEDLTLPGSIAWYEKSTGLLISGTFFYDEGASYITFSFIETNVEFTSIIDSLTVTNPDSTSSWETGTTQSITWTSTGSISDIKIELYKGDVFVMEILASTPNNDEFSWLIPTTLVDSTQYQIKISDVANPATDDLSDYFEILTPVAADTITVTTPDNISVWEMGTSQSITWTSTGSIANVKIDLYENDVFEKNIVASTANDGSFDWTIPTDLANGTDYRIRISDVSNPATYDDSPNFTITSVDIPGDGAIPGYNLYILIGVISLASVILIKNRKKLY